MKKKLKPIPKFKNEDEERDFWAKVDTSQYFDWSKVQPAVFPNLKPSTKSISLRLPQWLLDDLRVLANKRDMAYQALMKYILTEWVQKERRVQPV